MISPVLRFRVGFGACAVVMAGAVSLSVCASASAAQARHAVQAEPASAVRPAGLPNQYPPEILQHQYRLGVGNITSIPCGGVKCPPW